VFARPLPLLRSTLTLLATGAVTWGLWLSQYPHRDVSLGPFLGYPPSRTYTRVTLHGWPLRWLVRRATYDVLGGTCRSMRYQILPAQFTYNLFAVTMIVVCTQRIIWCRVWPRRRSTAWNFCSACLAVGILSSWYRCELEHAYVAHSAELTAILRDAPTTPLLRLMKCPAWVSVPVVGGLFCVLVQVNAWFIRTLGLGREGLQRLFRRRRRRC